MKVYITVIIIYLKIYYHFLFVIYLMMLSVTQAIIS